MNKNENIVDLARLIGGRIRDLRRQRHITQAELAERIGMRAGPLSAVEKGRHVPSGRVLFALSQALDVSMGEIFPARLSASASGIVSEESAPPYLADEPAVPFMSELDTKPLNAKSRLMVNSIARSFLALEDLCGAMKCALVPLYIPFTADEPGIERLAGQVRHHMGVTNAVVFDYLELMENSGLRVVFCKLPVGTFSVSAYDRRNGNAFFFINNRLTTERSLFRLVFELGRIYWHTRELFASGSSVSGSDEFDEVHMARKFAAFFLMPAVAVRATVGQIGIGPREWTYELLMRVKHRFGVSAETFTIRLEELSLIDAGIADDLKKRIRAYYKESGNKEPAGSMRKLMPNGRLGDLLISALIRSDAREEAEEIKALLKKHKIGV